ncbi:calmodulin-dependent protein kinase [Gigaspora margarita]|uniref:Calmodulin-dependent protein kinase n=1 Tax=Gigaspora margarita TaxID=4874 RepID=A0A8H4EIH0_GIGMA|nr:calmodulin-dependent protein kinase [Gigaspora margarita]
MDDQMNYFNIDNNYIKPLNDSFKYANTRLSKNSWKIISREYNKTMVLTKVELHQKYTLKDFINDLKKYQNVELHENILKFIGVINQSVDEIMFIHEYAYDGTLRRYLSQNFKKLNWYDKLRLAKQLVSAIKCLHENDIVHLNLCSEKVYIHKEDIKISAFKHQNSFINRFKYAKYVDSQYWQNVETYELNKSSDIYSLGILLWEISSGNIPFKPKLAHDFNLLPAIIHGKREVGIIGTPKKYIKIYTECWQHDSNLRPAIQKVFKELNNISGHKDEEVFTEHDQRNELKEKMISKRQGLNTEIPELLYYINTHNDLTNELKLITTVIKILSEKLLFGDQVNKQNSESPLYCSITINVQDNINDNHQFLYNLNQLFIYQFNKQGVSTYSSSIEYSIFKYISDNGKDPKEVFNQICYYEFKNYFTSIIGFFYEYGIGISVNHKKALNMYRQAAENDGLTFIDPLNKQGTSKNQKRAFQWYMRSAENGNKLGQSSLSYCYEHGLGTTENKHLAKMWHKESRYERNSLQRTFYR